MQLHWHWWLHHTGVAVVGTIDRSEELPELTHLCSVAEDNGTNYTLDIKHKLCATVFIHIAEHWLGLKPWQNQTILFKVHCKRGGRGVKGSRGRDSNWWVDSTDKNTVLLTHFTSAEYREGF